MHIFSSSSDATHIFSKVIHSQRKFSAQAFICRLVGFSTRERADPRRQSGGSPVLSYGTVPRGRPGGDHPFYCHGGPFEYEIG